MEDLIVGLDVGTTKTCAVIGLLNENNQVEVAGVGIAPTSGMKNGIIINIENTVVSIEKAVEDAELMAGHEVESVFMGISGQHVKGQNSKGVVAITNRNRSISSVEVKRVIEAAQAIVIPVDREIIHVLAKEFAVDDQLGIKDPVGMSGVRLEAEVHIITGLTSSLQNMTKAVSKAGFRYHDMAFNPIASAHGVLSKDEEELGVVLVDIGGGTTDIVVYVNGGIVFSAVLPVGGMNVTNDISIGLRTPFDSAEILKKKHGCAVLELVGSSEVVEVPSVGGRAPKSLFKQELTQIIEPRVIEIMEMIDQELSKSGVKEMLAAGIVLTGGGSMLEGAVESAERVFNMPVRIGSPKDIVGLQDIVSTPQYSNGVGLLKYGIMMNQFRGKNKFEKNKGNFFGKMRKWLEEYL